MNPLVYVVEYNGDIRGIWSTLKLARDAYITVRAEITGSEDFQKFIEHSPTEDWDDPIILVYSIDAGCIWSYDSVEEIENALVYGEEYD